MMASPKALCVAVMPITMSSITSPMMPLMKFFLPMPQVCFFASPSRTSSRWSWSYRILFETPLFSIVILSSLPSYSKLDAAEMDATDDFLAAMVDLSFLEEREEMTRANYGHSLKKRWEARVSSFFCNTKIPLHVYMVTF